MTILVGYPINRRAKAVLSLAGMLARSSGEDLLVCTVIPAPWMPGLSRADEGYRSYIDESAESALAQARADLAKRRIRQVHHGSIPVCSQRPGGGGRDSMRPA